MKSKPLKIAFFATPALAVPALKALANYSAVSAVSVVIKNPRPAGRGKKINPCPVQQTAEKLRLPIMIADRAADLPSICEQLDYDLGLVIGFGLLFPATLLAPHHPPLFNVHFSLLPKYRGATPVQSAILAGEKTSGITIQRLVHRLDAGPIFWQQTLSLVDRSTTDFWQEAGDITAQILPSFLSQHATINPREQDENLATNCQLLHKKDGLIQPYEQSAMDIWRRFLAFDPWPGVFLPLANGPLRFTLITKTPMRDSIGLRCANETTLFIHGVHPPGKKSQSALQWYQKNITIAEKLGLFVLPA